MGGHPVQPPFKIPESIIYYFLVTSDMRISLNIYVHLNVTKFDRHFVSVITTFFEVFRLFKFVNKIPCTENYLELHETMTSTETLLIKDSFGICFGICDREKFCVTCTWTLQGESFGIILQNIFGLYITV